MNENMHYKTIIFCFVIILSVCAVLWHKIPLFSFLLILFLIFSLYKKFLDKFFAIVLILIFALSAFYTETRIPTPDNLMQFAKQNVILFGKVASSPEKNSTGKIKFYFDVSHILTNSNEQKELKAKTLAYLPLENKILVQRGDNLKLDAYIFIPHYFGNEGEFNYKKFLSNSNIFTLSFVNDVEVLNTELSIEEKSLRYINKIRSKIIKEHSKYLSKEKLEILGGVVFGSEAIKPSLELKTKFIESGLYHLLAASGMNVAFIFGIWFFLLSFFKIPYRIIIISGGVVVLFYSLMTGLPPSVVRATWMLELALLGKLLDRNADNNVILLFICAFLLLLNPMMLYDIGFLLSFTVTFGLINCATPLIELFKFIPSKISGWFIIPFVAQIFAIPIQMYYFQTISLYSVIANMLVIPFMALVSFCGFISSILATIPKIGTYICCILDKINEPFLTFMLFVAEKFSQIPNNIAHVAKLNSIEILVYYILIFLLIYMLKIKFKDIKLNIVACLLFLYLVFNIGLKGYSNELSFTFFNVGEGDSIFIETPNGKKMLVDTGKYYSKTRNSGNSIILPFLKTNCIDEIDIMLLTHPDNDHIGGSVDILKNIKINKIITNGEKTENKAYKNLQKYLSINNIKEDIIENAENITLDEDINIFAIKPKEINNQSRNDTSIILLLKYKDFDAVLMGDNEINSYENLKQHLNPSGRIELFKLGHHGSKNSVDAKLANLIAPILTVISVGDNDYGHPNKKALSYLKNSTILRTDLDNSIKIKTDGSYFKIFTYNSQKSCWEKQHIN